MLHLEPLEARDLLSYTITDLGDFQATALNNWGAVAGRYHGEPAIWDGESIQILETPEGWHGAVPLALNDWGQAAGWGFGPNGPSAPLLWDARGAVPLPVLGSSSYSTQALAINNQQQVAGLFFGFPISGILWTPYRAPIDLGDARPAALNDAGQVVGTAGTSGMTYAFRYDLNDGSLETLAGPQGERSEGRGVNPQGDVVGDYAHNGFIFGVLWIDGQPIDIGSLYGNATFAIAANSSETVVGDTVGGQDGPAFIWTKADGLRDLNDVAPMPGQTWIAAVAINEAGQILATSRDGQNGYHDAVLTPDAAPGGQPGPAWLGWALGLERKEKLS